MGPEIMSSLPRVSGELRAGAKSVATERPALPLGDKRAGSAIKENLPPVAGGSGEKISPTLLAKATRWWRKFYEQQSGGKPLGPETEASIYQKAKAGEFPPMSGGAWAEDEFLNNSNPALNIANPAIRQRVIEPLDLIDEPSVSDLKEALKELGQLIRSGSVPSADPEVRSVRDRLNAKMQDPAVKARESTWPSPEIPQTPEAWIALVREQLRHLERMGESSMTLIWENKIELKSILGQPIPRGLEQMQDHIANMPILIESEGQIKSKTFKERLFEEIRAREKLHTRFTIWRNGAALLKNFLDTNKLLAGDCELSPDVLEALSAMMPQPGQARLSGDNLSKAFWAYRMIARNSPFDAQPVRIDSDDGFSRDNLFARPLSKDEALSIHSRVKALVGGDQDAQELGFRLAHVWREAAWGDNQPEDEAKGAKTGNSDATSRLTYFEKWRNNQTKQGQPERVAGPKITLKGKYPEKLLLPFLDSTPYQYEDSITGDLTPKVSLKEALEADPDHLLRNIRWHGNRAIHSPDLVYVIAVTDAVSLFDKLVTGGVSEDDISRMGFLKFNKLVDDVISPVVIAEQFAKSNGYGEGIGYWHSGTAEEIAVNQKRLKAETQKLRYDTRLWYVKGLKHFTKMPGKLVHRMVEAAREAKSINPFDAFSL